MAPITCHSHHYHISNTTHRHPLDPDVNGLHLKLERFGNAGTPQASACCSVDVHHGNLFAVGSLQFHHERTSLDGTPFKPCLSRKGKTLAPAVPTHDFTGKKPWKPQDQQGNIFPPQPVNFCLLMRMHLGGESHRMLKAQSGQILWNWLVPDTMYGNIRLTKIVGKYCSVYF